MIFIDKTGKKPMDNENNMMTDFPLELQIYSMDTKTLASHYKMWANELWHSRF